ncbi:MAG TPA: phosphoribosyl-ATP diphosphatase [Alphaproteobacteria bacterium]|nr:phosphoribosyl-ATP diphosphatase [Alphaproteobacteria bacterium]
MLDELFAVIEQRRDADPESSWTARLFARGTPKIAQKVGEEATETVIAALAESDDALANESADLIYHLLVLWAARGITPAQVYAVLAGRRGKRGIREDETPE